MGILSWLRTIVADFFGADRDTVRRACDAAETQVRSSKNLAAVAVAQARRAALELQELLSEREPGQAELHRAVAEAEEAQRRATEQVAEYRRRAAQLQEQIERAEKLQLLEAANEERKHLVRLAQRPSVEVDLGALDEVHDEARAEAARLDTLDRLNAGTFQPQSDPGADDETIDSLKARADALLGARSGSQGR